MSKGRYGSTWPAKSELLKLKTNRIWFDKFTMNVLHMYYFSIGTEFVIDIINSLVWDTLYLSALSRKKNLQMGTHPCQILANCCFTEEILPTSGSLPDPCHLHSFANNSLSCSRYFSMSPERCYFMPHATHGCP